MLLFRPSPLQQTNLSPKFFLSHTLQRTKSTPSLNRHLNEPVLNFTNIYSAPAQSSRKLSLSFSYPLYYRIPSTSRERVHRRVQFSHSGSFFGILPAAPTLASPPLPPLFDPYAPPFPQRQEERSIDLRARSLLNGSLTLRWLPSFFWRNLYTRFLILCETREQDRLCVCGGGLVVCYIYWRVCVSALCRIGWCECGKEVFYCAVGRGNFGLPVTVYWWLGSGTDNTFGSLLIFPNFFTLWLMDRYFSCKNAFVSLEHVFIDDYFFFLFKLKLVST